MHFTFLDRISCTYPGGYIGHSHFQIFILVASLDSHGAFVDHAYFPSPPFYTLCKNDPFSAMASQSFASLITLILHFTSYLLLFIFYFLLFYFADYWQLPPYSPKCIYFLLSLPSPNPHHCTEQLSSLKFNYYTSFHSLGIN